MPFVVPTSFAEAQSTLLSQSENVAGKRAIFYSGPLDENGNNTGANYQLAKECAELYPNERNR